MVCSAFSSYYNIDVFEMKKVEKIRKNFKIFLRDCSKQISGKPIATIYYKPAGDYYQAEKRYPPIDILFQLFQKLEYQLSFGKTVRKGSRAARGCAEL